jgi:hypothetical protein
MPSREPILRRGSHQIRSCCFAASGFLLPPRSHKRTRISALRESVIKLGWSWCCHNLYHIRFQPSTFCFQNPPFQPSGSLSSLGIRKLRYVCKSCGLRCTVEMISQIMSSSSRFVNAVLLTFCSACSTLLSNSAQLSPACRISNVYHL